MAYALLPCLTSKQSGARPIGIYAASVDQVLAHEYTV